MRFTVAFSHMQFRHGSDAIAEGQTFITSTSFFLFSVVSSVNSITFLEFQFWKLNQNDLPLQNKATLAKKERKSPRNGNQQTFRYQANTVIVKCKTSGWRVPIQTKLYAQTVVAMTSSHSAGFTLRLRITHARTSPDERAS